MQGYEIRILGQGHGDIIIEVVHLNDNAAVRSARKMAEGKPFEVWRGLDCVYGGARNPSQDLVMARPRTGI
jgi:hypothetical protein